MRFEFVNESTSALAAVAVRRMVVDRIRWRVVVETWDDGGVWRGRLVFQPDDPTKLWLGRRRGPPTLRGRSREDVVGLAHEVSERRLRTVFHSLG